MFCSRQLRRPFVAASRSLRCPACQHVAFSTSRSPSSSQNDNSPISHQDHAQPDPENANVKQLCHDKSLSTHRPKRIVVGITGATGTVLAIRLLEVLKQLGIETHLVVSKWALATMKYETPRTEADLHALATHVYNMKNMSAAIASGSFLTDGMIIVPCSMKTLAAVRIGFCDDLISRAADVTLKERRPLMLVVRETPLSDIHLDNMLYLRRAGAVIFPPVPAFYTRPDSIESLIDQSVGRMLDSFGIHTDGFERWEGFKKR